MKVCVKEDAGTGGEVSGVFAEPPRHDVIAVRAPLKAGLAGGGSDLPSYYRWHPGRCLNLALELSIGVTYEPGPSGLIVFTAPTGADTVVGEVMIKCSGLLATGGVRVELPVLPGCGLGCSSALAVALTAIRFHLTGQSLRPERVAEAAWTLEAVQMGLPVGKQDHYATAFGGVNLLEFRPGSVAVRPVPLADRRDLEQCFLLLRVGAPRNSHHILGRQVSGCLSDGSRIVDAIRQRVELVPAFESVLRRGDLDALGHLMRADWRLKAQLDPQIYETDVRITLDRAIDAGALGGRLLGAGGSGYLMILSRPADREEVRRRLQPHVAEARIIAPTWSGLTLLRRAA